MSVYLISYAASYLFARAGYYLLSGLVLILAAVFLYWYDYSRTGNVVHLRGIFSLFWVGGQGVSCLKLSKLQGDWNIMTWLCFLLALLGFWVTFEFLEKRRETEGRQRSKLYHFQEYEKPLFWSMMIVTIVSLIAFLAEILVLGFVPILMKGMPHAYSVFHITGVHYFTVSCVLVPALSVMYFGIERRRDTFHTVLVLLMDVAACVIPILCVSRFQLILAVAMAVVTYIVMENQLRFFHVICLVVGMIPVYILLTIARGHDVSYLNSIFQMKSSQIPIFITQPYIYIANNYDNFNCMVEQLPSHTLGLRMLFPVWALTGLKFVFPSLVNFPIYVTKEELTTVTLFYDAYYDFGILGVLAFSCLLGAAAYLLMKMVKTVRNPIVYLFYAQAVVYLSLSFFTTWFSNPTTWFYFAVTGLISCFCVWGNNKAAIRKF